MSSRNALFASMSQGALIAGLIANLPGVAEAQTPTTDGTMSLPEVSVSGQRDSPNTLQRPTGIDRLPGTIQSTPQAITVVPREVLQQQNVTTLDQALRNVPGITASIGEGNGGVNGDQFRIRGFNAQNDVYVDGLRDFGSYTRDAFDIDSVTVLKGPSALTFGPGNVGGAININSRSATLGNFGNVTGSGGMGPFGRLTFDLNRQIDPTTAVRLGIMGNYSGIVGRDLVNSGRFGFAPSVSFGLGTPLTWTLDYFHQSTLARPDYGVPVVAAPGTSIAKPVTEFGVPRSTFYGIDKDRDDTSVDRFTSRVRWQANDWLTVHNDTRFSYVYRDFAATPASCTGTCITYLFDNNPRTVPQYTVGGGVNPFIQRTYGVQNITTANANFTTGFLRHEVTAGVDVNNEYDSRNSETWSPSRTGGSLFDPNHDGSIYSISDATSSTTAERRINSFNLGVFAFDRAYLTPELSVIGGFRWNQFNTDYDTFAPGAARTKISADNDFVDPRAGLVYEPTSNQTYYFSYAMSTQSPGQFIASLPFSFTAANSNLAPERARIYEVGAKFSFFDARLGLTGSLFRIEKDNALTVDPIAGTVTSSGDQQRVQGFEVGATGRITRNWNVNVTYTYLDAQTTSSATAANVGKQVQYTPQNAVSLWTTYDLLRDTPYNLTVGAGLIYRSKVYLTAANDALAPDTISVDALISHQINDKMRVQVNGYNLTDRLNYDGVFGSRVIPSLGRTVTASLSVDF